MTTKKDIGLAVRTLRKKAGIKTQEELAKKLNPKPVSKGTINSVETGKGNYNINLLFRIAEALGCDISEFFESTGEVKISITKDNLEMLQHMAGMFKKIMKME